MATIQLTEEMTHSEWLAAAKALKCSPTLVHGGKGNKCVSSFPSMGQECIVFQCSDCERICCDCAGGDDEGGPALCSDCWCKNNGVSTEHPGRLIGGDK